MFFDRESTVVITKLHNLSESVLTSYCQKFGTVLRCFIKSSSQTPKKDLYALVKFADVSSVASIISHRNHIINGTHVAMRFYHEDRPNASSSLSRTQTTPNLMPISQQKQNSPNNPAAPSYEQLVQENQALKHDIANLQKSLVEAQTYSRTAYDTFQVLREKFEAEQALTNKLKQEHAVSVESYEARLKQLSETSATIPKDKVKDEPIDCHNQENRLANHLLEIQIVKDCLEQAQIDLGKCQTENAILNAKLNSREQQFEAKYKELNNQYLLMKKKYEHISSCVKDFHLKLYPRKRVKAESKEERSSQHMDDSNDDVVEIVMQVDAPACEKE
ncbi:unnamed protein product [Adineta ricciae]|uniref:RRM domain-containing protein n=1 Tax=Adineta ricciae TaxID=249248 RepID=A0A813XAS6_ADIRI|nr:unnamed protein product [Adineta ricciae]